MPDRIVLILPCCIGDVVLATAALVGLRRAYPAAHLTWAVGSWSAPVLRGHPHLNALLDSGSTALPTGSWRAAYGFQQQLRAGQFDAAVSLVRSATVNMIIALSGIPMRVGLNSGGRGLMHTIRAPLNPNEPQHEADIYLSVLRAWGIDTRDCLPFVAVSDEDRAVMLRLRQRKAIHQRYLVVNPAGGSNPGMTMDSKRYPPPLLAQLAMRVRQAAQAELVLVGGPGDNALIAAVQSHLDRPAATFIGELTMLQLGALARDALAYIGNDTGMTHLANACGARTIMIMGPTDPRRYAPYKGDSLAVWKPAPVSVRGVATPQANWSWERDGISVEEAFVAIQRFLS